MVTVPPRTAPGPLVFDSPHSGSLYPEGFETLVPMARLRRAEGRRALGQGLGRATEGRSVPANLALAENNARVAGEIAVALSG